MNSMCENEQLLTDYEWMCLCRELSKKSLCEKAKYAAVIVDTKMKSVFGINGLEFCCTNCTRKGMKSGDHRYGSKCPALHAEESAILSLESDMRDLTMYIYGTPCEICCNRILKAGIKKVVYKRTHDYDDGIKRLVKNGVNVFEFDL